MRINAANEHMSSKRGASLRVEIQDPVQEWSSWTEIHEMSSRSLPCTYPCASQGKEGADKHVCPEHAPGQVKGTNFSVSPFSGHK